VDAKKGAGLGPAECNTHSKNAANVINGFFINGLAGSVGA
jgi:hypothetical protein